MAEPADSFIGADLLVRNFACGAEPFRVLEDGHNITIAGPFLSAS